MSVVYSAMGNDFSSYDSESFENYMDKLEALKDSMNNFKNKLIENSSEKEYQLYARMLEVVKQTSIQNKYEDKYY